MSSRSVGWSLSQILGSPGPRSETLSQNRKKNGFSDSATVPMIEEGQATSCTGWLQNLATQFTSTGFACIKNTRTMGAWRHAPRLQRAAEARQWMAGSDSWQGGKGKPLYETIKMTPKLQWMLEMPGPWDI